MAAVHSTSRIPLAACPAANVWLLITFVEVLLPAEPCWLQLNVLSPHLGCVRLAAPRGCSVFLEVEVFFSCG